jgi:hypothetical protein
MVQLEANIAQLPMDFWRKNDCVPRWTFRGGINLIATALCTLILGSCDWGPERWEPLVVDVTYDRGGQTGTLALGGIGAATLEVNEGDHLTMKVFNLRMFPVKRTPEGSISARVLDIPAIHQDDLNMEVRVSATLRKIQGSGPCWDVKGRVTTDWKQADTGTWSLLAPSADPWIMGPTSDEIRINVLFRNLGSEQTEEYTNNFIELRPVRLGGLQSNNQPKGVRKKGPIRLSGIAEEPIDRVQEGSQPISIEPRCKITAGKAFA